MFKTLRSRIPHLVFALFFVNLSIPLASWGNGNCDLLDVFATREKAHSKLIGKYTGGRSSIRRNLDALLERDRKQIAELLDKVLEGGVSEKEAFTELEKYDVRLRRSQQAIKDLAPIDRSLVSLKTQIFTNAPSVRGLLDAEAKRLEELFEEMVAKGSYDQGKLTSVKTRLESLNVLVADGKGIRYVNPGHHDQSKAGFSGGQGGTRSQGAGTSPLPSDHEDLWRKAIPDTPLGVKDPRPDKRWWSFDGKDYHRFDARLNQVTNEYEFHWNGSTRAVDDKGLVIPQDKVPVDVRDHFVR